MAKNTPKAPKKHWWSYIGDVYRLTTRTYSWMKPALIGSAIAGLAIGLIAAAVTKHWISWSIFGVLLAITFPLTLMTLFVRKASYAQIEGMTGASAAVLDSIGGSWNTSTEPVRFNRNQDMVWRAVGRPGIVLVAEGPKSRASKLIQDERRYIKHAIGKVPVHVFYVGSDEGQIPVSKLSGAIKKLPKAITKQEVYALSNRLTAVSNNKLPIPKGIDPTNTHMSRRALRG